MANHESWNLGNREGSDSVGLTTLHRAIRLHSAVHFKIAELARELHTGDLHRLQPLISAFEQLGTELLRLADCHAVAACEGRPARAVDVKYVN